jgi:hypothetical protein
MDRDMFAKGVFRSHDHSTDKAAVETEILRIGADHRAVSDLASFAEDHRTDDLGMTADHTPRADADSGLDHREGTDFNIIREFRSGFDKGSGMDFHGKGRSLLRAPLLGNGKAE